MDPVAAILETERMNLLDHVFDSLSIQFKSPCRAAKIMADIKATYRTLAVKEVVEGAVNVAVKQARPPSAYPVFQRVVKTLFVTSSLKDVKATKTGAWVREDYERFDRLNRPDLETDYPDLVGTMAFEDVLMTRFVIAMVVSRRP